MHSAYLHNDVVDIENERIACEREGMPRDGILRWLEERYRVFSKKGAFTCLCCDKPVTMNLTKEEGRPFYFRHNDESECAYSENTRTYEKQVNRMENVSTKDLGLTLLRDMLSGLLNPYDIEVQRGFHCKEKLAFVPDFIVRFPDSAQVYAIDFFTSLEQGLRSGSYAKHLRKRMKWYQEEGIGSLSFVDISWLSYLEETNKGTLLRAEEPLRLKTEEDVKWDHFFETELSEALQSVLQREAGLHITAFDTRSVIYLDTSNQNCTIYRHLWSQEADLNLTVYSLTNTQVPLNHLLQVNLHDQTIEMVERDEQEQRAAFLKYITDKKKQHDMERENEQDRFRFDQVTNEDKDQRRQTRAAKQRSVSHKKHIRRRDAEDEKIETEMRERARRAKARPVNQHPDYLNRESDGLRAAPSSVTERSATRQAKREELKHILLTQQLPGDLYINGHLSAWRTFILYWIKDHESGNRLEVSVSRLIQDMRAAGFTFQQNDSLVEKVLADFLTFYQKQLKEKLKKRVELALKR